MSLQQTDRYDDIINLPHHRSRTRPHMSMHNRAAQFFCALCRKAPAKINCTECLIRRCRALQRAKELRGTAMPRLRK